MQELGWIVFALMLAMTATRARGGETIEGVWTVTEIGYVWEGGEQAIESPEPGLLIFADGHYSMTWHHRAGRQPDYATTWKPTDAEKVAAYNAIVVNAGTYEVKGDTLITRPQVAKTVEFEGGRGDWTWRIEDGGLQLRSGDILNYKGDMDPGVGAFVTQLRCARKP